MALSDDVQEFIDSKNDVKRDATLFDKIVNSPLGVDLTDKDGNPIDTMRQALEILKNGGYDFTNIPDPAAPLNPVNKQYLENNALLKSDNLASLIDKAAARSNLGIELPEIGFFDPVIEFNGSSAGQTYSYREGIYFKFGKHVTEYGRISLTNKGSGTGQARVKGRPFAPVGHTIGILEHYLTASSAYWENSYIISGGDLRAKTHIGLIGLNHGHFNDNTQITYQMTYRVNS